MSMSKDRKPVRKKIRETPEVVDLTMWPAEYHARTDQFRPLLGGIGIQSTTMTATLGLCCYTLTGANAVITAAHVFTNSDQTLGQYLQANMIGTSLGQAPPYGGANVDVALVVVPGIGIQPSWVLGDIIPYEWESYATFGDVGGAVQIEGLISGTSQGKIVYANAQIAVGGQIEAAGVANYASQPGDSGAPVIWWDDDEPTFIGIHGGQVQVQGQWQSWYVPFAAFQNFAEF